MAESQDQFLYGSAVEQNLTLRISAPRLAPYLGLPEVAGNFDQAMKWYLWNSRLAKAFLFPLQTAEVTLRNSIHAGLSSFLNGPDWIKTHPFSLNAEHRSAMAASVTRLKRTKPKPSSDDIVAALSMDFWSNLFREDYEALWMVPGLIATIFPHAPSGADRPRIQKLVRRTNWLRNRIAHHEPIHHLQVEGYLADIQELVGFICADTARWMQNNTTVQAVRRAQPTFDSVFTGLPLSSSNIRPPLVLPPTTKLPDAIRQMKRVKPAVGLVADTSKTPPFALVSLGDIASFIEQIAGQPDDIIDLNQHSLGDVIAGSAPAIIGEITSSSSVGDAVAMFFPKGKAAPKPVALIVRESGGGSLKGVILKPTIRM